MKVNKNKGLIISAFTLVELLVVITILAIISVVAYQNFWWAVDKAVSGRKISDVSTIESSLQQYKVDKNFYPPVDLLSSSTNKWWYSTWTNSTPSNTLVVVKTWEEVTSISSANWWGRVMWLNWTVDWTWKQVWAKWTISQATLWKKYLTKDLYDPELWDVKVGWTWKMIDYWVGRYVYAVFKKPLSTDTTWWASNKEWTYYNIAYTIKVDWWDKYITKIVWDYDSESCFDEKAMCPNTLIWSSSSVLSDWEENSNSNTSSANQWIPYPVDWY
jgi:prepilin-type N-terminal cleavage/methylation domain-containing protein